MFPYALRARSILPSNVGNPADGLPQKTILSFLRKRRVNISVAICCVGQTSDKASPPRADGNTGDRSCSQHLPRKHLEHLPRYITGKNLMRTTYRINVDGSVEEITLHAKREYISFYFLPRSTQIRRLLQCTTLTGSV